MLIAEDLLLLLTDDETGALPSAMSGFVDATLAGAVLAELVVAGDVELDEPRGVFRRRIVRPTAWPSVEDPLLLEAMEAIGEAERTPSTLLGKLGKGLRARCNDRLAAKGILERRRESVLVVFERTRWPAVDVAHEQQVRHDLDAAMLHGATPSPRTAALVGLLDATRQLHHVVDGGGRSRRELRDRAKEIAEGSWASAALRDHLDAITAAVTAALAAGYATTT